MRKHKILPSKTEKYIVRIAKNKLNIYMYEYMDFV